MSTSKLPWRSFQHAHQTTWGSDLPEGVEVIAYFKAGRTHAGHRASARLRERLRFGRTGILQRLLDSPSNRRLRRLRPELTISPQGYHIAVPDEIHYNSAARIAVLREFVESGFDGYVFRTNSTAYVNAEVLLNRIEQGLGTEYAGIVESGVSFWSTDFVNGSGILLGPQTICSLVACADRLDHRYPDDVSVSRLLCELGIAPSDLNSLVVRNQEELWACPDAVLAQFDHVRLRLPVGQQREDDLMREIHARVVAWKKSS